MSIELPNENVVGVVGKAISVLNYNRPAIRYLYDYYKGDQPIHYREKKVRPDINNKTCENHALEIVRFSTSQTYGSRYSMSAEKQIKKSMMPWIN